MIISVFHQLIPPPPVEAAGPGKTDNSTLTFAGRRLDAGKLMEIAGNRLLISRKYIEIQYVIFTI